MYRLATKCTEKTSRRKCEGEFIDTQTTTMHWFVLLLTEIVLALEVIL